MKMRKKQYLDKLPYPHDYISQREWLIDSLEQLGLIEIKEPVSPISKFEKFLEIIDGQCGPSLTEYLIKNVKEIYGND